MPRFLSKLLGPLAAAALVASVPATAHAMPVVGIADQKPAMFDDVRFTGLHLKTARIFVPYDFTENPAQVAAFDRWMAGAKRDGIAPLVTLERSSDIRRRHIAPSVATYRKQIRKLLKRYPTVKALSVWNEANHGGQPLSRKPQLAARYYRVIQQECPSCTILAADLLDQPNMESWAKAFVKALGREPKYWGLHNYLDANRFSTSGTSRLLKAVKGKIWLTEVGGLVSRRNTSQIAFAGKGPEHAKKVTAFIFDKLAKLSPRIQRVYLYHWNASTKHDSWDSAFIDATGKERPALDVVRARLGLPLGPPPGLVP